MTAIHLLPWVTAAALPIAYLHLHLRASAAFRQRLRPHAERLIIEKRWTERHATRPAEFQKRWNAELQRLYKASVSAPRRLVFKLRHFERALNAEFACILTQEIASWTYVDRKACSSTDFEHLTLHRLEMLGWSLHCRIGGLFILSRGSERVTVAAVWAPCVNACLAVHDVAAAARAGNLSACVITNGRLDGPAYAMARELGVTVLHCSQIDQIEPQAAALGAEMRLLAA